MEYLSNADFLCHIKHLDNAPRDGRCWELTIFQRVIMWDHWNDEAAEEEEDRGFNYVPEGLLPVYEGKYTAKIGAERAAKRQFKKLNAKMQESLSANVVQK